MNALRSAVVADPVDGRVVVGGVDYRAVVDIRNSGVVDIICGAVVVEIVPLPVAALVAPSGIAVAVVHAAIKSDIPAPVAMIEAVSAIAEAPIAGRPERSLVGRRGPGSRDPVIAGRSIGPVSGSPKIARLGNRRLIIFRQRRRRLRGILIRSRIVRRFAIILIGLVIIPARPVTI